MKEVTCELRSSHLEMRTTQKLRATHPHDFHTDKNGEERHHRSVTFLSTAVT